MSSGLMENICPHSVDPFTRVKRSQDPAMLSMIAASAANLQVTMPHDIGNERDQARTAIAQDAMSQQSMETMTHSEDLDSAKSVDESTERQRFKPVPGPLIEPFPAESGLEVGSCHETCGLEKPLGRAQKVRGKFTDSRRQEVQNIRKKGACIRCRMLRKTVSSRQPSPPACRYHTAK